MQRCDQILVNHRCTYSRVPLLQLRCTRGSFYHGRLNSDLYVGFPLSAPRQALSSTRPILELLISIHWTWFDSYYSFGCQQSKEGIRSGIVMLVANAYVSTHVRSRETPNDWFAERVPSAHPWPATNHAVGLWVSCCLLWHRKSSYENMFLVISFLTPQWVRKFRPKRRSRSFLRIN